MHMPYKYQILEHRFGTAQEISDLEKALQAKIRKFKYIPAIAFNGKQECFSVRALDIIKA